MTIHPLEERREEEKMEKVENYDLILVSLFYFLLIEKGNLRKKVVMIESSNVEREIYNRGYSRYLN